MLASSKNRLLFALLLGVFAIAGFWMLRSREPSLLDHARRIANTQHIPSEPDSYFWLNDSEFLYLTPMQKVGAFQVMRRNITTGDEALQGNLLSGGFQLSPNGLWSLTYNSARVGSVFTVERTDGSRKLLYRSPGQGQPELAWMPDNSSCVELLAPFMENGKTHPGLMRVYSLDTAVPIASTSVDEDSQDLAMLGALANNHVLVTDRFPKYQPNGELLISDRVNMLDFSMERNTVARHYTIPKPPNALDIAAAVSPAGDRIAWLFGIVHKPLGYDSIERFYNLLHIKTSYSASLWISKPDGSDMRELGRFALKNPFPILNNPRWPTNLRWTTNGQNVSFLYLNNLYLVPAR